MRHAWAKGLGVRACGQSAPLRDCDPGAYLLQRWAYLGGEPTYLVGDLLFDHAGEADC